MSIFLSGPINNYMTISARYNDDRNLRFDYRRNPVDIRDGTGYVRLLWPASDFAGQTGGPAGYLTAAHQNWDLEQRCYPTGVHRERVVSGQTRFPNGSINGGVTVQLFNTATGLLVDTQVSDAAGNFTLNDPNNVACFIVAYEAGSPDVAGTSVNNLSGI